MDLNINITDPCRIQVLLVPIFPIKRSVFIHYANLVKKFTTLNLSEVTTLVQNNEEAMFSNNNFQEGQLHFKFLLQSTSDNQDLYNFQPHRRIFGIIGIMDCQEWKNRPLSEGYEPFITSLEKYSIAPITRCFAFDPVDSQPDDTKGVIMIPNVGDISFYLNTMMYDFASEILSQFSLLVKEIGQQLSIESSAHSNTKNNMDDDLNRNSINGLQRDSISPSPSTSSSSSFSNTTSISTNVTTNNNNSNKISSPNLSTRNKKFIPGRIKKIYGDFYLLSGRIPDAIMYYRQSIDMTRITSDYLWLASAMEGYLCATILLEQLRIEKDVNISTSYGNDIPLPSSPDSLKQEDKNTTTSTSTSASASPPASSSSSKPQINVNDILNQYNAILSYYAKEMPKLSAVQSKHKLDMNYNNYISSNDKKMDGSFFSADKHSLIYSEACLKVSRFLLTIYNIGKWDKETLYLLLQGSVSKSIFSSSPSSPNEALPDTPISMSHLDKYGQSVDFNQHLFKVESADINLWITRVWEAHIDRLDVTYQIHLLTNMATIYSTIDYHRKASWVTFESIKRMQPLLLNNINSTTDKKLKSSKEGLLKNDGVLNVLKYICNGYGISDDDEHTLNNNDSSKIFEKDYKIKHLSFGWPSLQLAVLRQSIIISEMMHAYDDMLYYTTILLKNLYPYLLKDEQIQLANSIQRIAARRKRAGAPHRDNNYWDVNIILDIKALDPIPRAAVHQHLSFSNIILDNYNDYSSNNSNDTTHHKNNELNATAITKTDPFIYNPFATIKSEEKKRMLVKNEIAEFEVMLSNPFGFDLELQNISLSTSGLSFNSIQNSLIIPAYQNSKIRLSGIPEETGTLVIRGCNIKIAGFMEQEFLFNINKECSEMYTGIRIKHSGLKMKEFEKTQVECKDIIHYQLPVITEQPFLKLKSSSLIQGAIMLFEGERNCITMTFENIGKIPIDFIGLTFTDNSPKHEDIETDYIKKTVFSWDNKTSQNDQMIGKKVWIQPGSTLDVTFDIYGKRGCSQGNIQVDYGYLNRYKKMDAVEELPKNNDMDVALKMQSSSDISEHSNIFYTKQLYISILITVHQPLEISNWDIHYLRLGERDEINECSPCSLNQPIIKNAGNHSTTNINKSVQTWTNDQTAENVIHLIENNVPFISKLSNEYDINDCDDSNDYCLASLDIMNKWTIPIDIQLVINNSDSSKIEKEARDVVYIKNKIEPGTTIRVLLPIKRMILSEEPVINLPIQTKKQLESLQINKYRTKLLQRIKATWVSEITANIIREGDLDMKSGIQLTVKQLDKLKKPSVHFSPALVGPTVNRVNYKHFTCQCDQNITLKMSITNLHVDRPGRFILYLRPLLNVNETTMISDLQDKVFMQGLNQIILPKISIQEKAQHEVSLYFLAKGRFEFIYHLQDIETKQIYYDHEKLIIDVTT